MQTNVGSVSSLSEQASSAESVAAVRLMEALSDGQQSPNQTAEWELPSDRLGQAGQERRLKEQESSTATVPSVLTDASVEALSSSVLRPTSGDNEQLVGVVQDCPSASTGQRPLRHSLYLYLFSLIGFLIVIIFAWMDFSTYLETVG
jgi:hypothetical protein